MTNGGAEWDEWRCKIVFRRVFFRFFADFPPDGIPFGVTRRGLSVFCEAYDCAGLLNGDIIERVELAQPLRLLAALWQGVNHPCCSVPDDAVGCSFLYLLFFHGFIFFCVTLPASTP